MNLLTRLFALHFDRSFSGKGWRQLAWLFGVIVTVFLLIYLISFAFIFPEPSLEEWTGIDKDVPMGRLLQLICLFIDPGEYCGSTTLSALVLSIGRSAGINFVLRIIDIRNLQYAGTQS